MSREIKFRAWFHDGGQDGLGCMATLNNEEIDDCLDDGYVVMQYTGLKDKNGKEIYEGDIVILEEDDTKEYFNEPLYLQYGDICIVEWSNTNLAYYLMPVNENREEQQMDYYGSWSGWNWLKVIGNIYENPDLL